MAEEAQPKKGRGGRREGAGRKPNAVRLELAQLFNDSVGLGDRREILKTAVSLARAGSIKHAEFLFAYLYGKPTQRLEHAGDPEAPLRVVYVNDWRGTDSGDQS